MRPASWPLDACDQVIHNLVLLQSFGAKVPHQLFYDTRIFQLLCATGGDAILERLRDVRAFFFGLAGLGDAHPDV